MSTNIYSDPIPDSPYRIHITNWGMDGYCSTIVDDKGNLEIVDLRPDFNGQAYLDVINKMRKEGELPYLVEMRAKAIEFTINYLEQFKVK